MKHATPRSSLILSLGLAFAATSVNAALVLHYDLDEAAGTSGGGSVNDSSASNIDATPGGGVIFGAAGLASGTSVDLPGSNNNNVVSDSASTTAAIGIDGNNARTISLWFNADAITSGQSRLLGTGTGGGASFDITLENNTNSGNENRVGLRYGNGNVYFNSDNSSTFFATGTTYHLAMTYDGTTLNDADWSDTSGLSVFVNGVQVTSRAAGNANSLPQSLITSSDNVFVGSKRDGTSVLDGRIDDLQIYDQALTPSQVSFLFSNPGAVIPEPSTTFLLTSLGIFGLVACRRRTGR